MEAIVAENQSPLSLLQQVEREEEETHRLSFSNLPTPQTDSASATSSAHHNHLFEFSAAHPAAAAAGIYHNDIVFCGKIIHEEEDEEEELNEYQKRDYFATVRSKSLRKPSSPESERRRLSASTRLSGELARPRSSTAADLDYHVQRVNISSLTSMSEKSRRRMFMFGPVKFKPEMELSAIKQRQGKTALAAGKKAAAPPRKSHWGAVKSALSGRSHLASLLARSLGCVRAAGGAGNRWGLGVAN